MKGRYSLIASILIIVGMAALPFVEGHEDSLHVIITAEDGTYKAGETAEVEVHVFQAENRVDADGAPLIELYMSNWETGEESSREVPTERSSQGRYTGSIAIYDSDSVTSPGGVLHLKDPIEIGESRTCALTKGYDGEGDTTYDYLTSYEGNYVPLYFDQSGDKKGFDITYRLKEIPEFGWVPGDLVEFDVITTKNGEMVEPDSLSVDADHSFDEMDDTSGVPYNNPSTGLYEASFTIPSTIRTNGNIEVEIEAELGERSAAVYFDIPIDHFHVWCHRLPGNDTHYNFEIYVADREGKIVSGAEVGTEIYVEGSYDHEYRIVTTDPSGKAQFSVGEMDMELDIDLWVTKDGKNQTAYLSLYRNEEETQDGEPTIPEPGGWGLELLTLDNDAYRSGDRMTHELWLFNDGEPVNNTNVVYYAYTNNAVLGVDKYLTDENGKIVIGFDTPEVGTSVIKVDVQVDLGYHPGVFEGYGWEESDQDGFSDSFEEHMGTDPRDSDSYPVSMVDSDNDGYTDAFETNEGTDPSDETSYPYTYRDSDGDHFGDAYEINESTDPEDPDDFPSDWKDTDEDGFGDLYEIEKGTNPDASFSYPTDIEDTDSDGFSDGQEEFYGTNATDISSYPRNSYEVNSDGDYVYGNYYMMDPQFDLEEEFYGTDPQDSEDTPYNEYGVDSDSDWFCDLEENFYGTDPDNRYEYPVDEYQMDSDYDGVCDPEEEFYGTDPYDRTESPDYEPSPWDSRYSDHNSTDGRRYLSESTSLYLSGGSLNKLMNDDIKVSVEGLKVGGASRMIVDSPVKSGSGSCMVFCCGLQGMEELAEENTVPDWQSLTYNNDGLYSTDDGLEGYLVLPEFLPSGDQEYTVIGGFGEEGMMNYVTLKDGQSGSSASGASSQEDGPPVLLFIGIGLGALVIMMIILIVVIVLVARSKKKKGAGEKRSQQQVQPQPQPQNQPAQQPQTQVPQTQQQVQPQPQPQNQPAQQPQTQAPQMQQQAGQEPPMQPAPAPQEGQNLQEAPSTEISKEELKNNDDWLEEFLKPDENDTI